MRYSHPVRAGPAYRTLWEVAVFGEPCGLRYTQHARAHVHVFSLVNEEFMGVGHGSKVEKARERAASSAIAALHARGFYVP